MATLPYDTDEGFGNLINNPQDPGTEQTGSIGTEQTGSIGVKISLSQVLSLTGIELPSVPSTGSFPIKKELPKDLEFGDVEGIVVDSQTNEPISGVRISNILQKRTRTDQENLQSNIQFYLLL